MSLPAKRAPVSMSARGTVPLSSREMGTPYGHIERRENFLACDWLAKSQCAVTGVVVLA